MDMGSRCLFRSAFLFLAVYVLANLILRLLVTSFAVGAHHEIFE